LPSPLQILFTRFRPCSVPVYVSSAARSFSSTDLFFSYCFEFILPHGAAMLCAVLEVVILSICLPVRPSVTRVLCDKPKQSIADILISHERAITLVCWNQQWLVDNIPFCLKFALKLTYPLRKTPTSTDFRL